MRIAEKPLGRPTGPPDGCLLAACFLGGTAKSSNPNKLVFDVPPETSRAPSKEEIRRDRLSEIARRLEIFVSHANGSAWLRFQSARLRARPRGYRREVESGRYCRDVAPFSWIKIKNPGNSQAWDQAELFEQQAFRVSSPLARQPAGPKMNGGCVPA